jgi:predicted Zn finger-like uncharacterized protein
MRIVCPSCAAVFDVPKVRLVPGQAVRCARCSTDWTPLALPGPASDIPAAEPLEPPGIAAQPPKPESAGAHAAATPLVDQPASGPSVQSHATQGRLPSIQSVLDRLNLTTATEAALIAAWAVSIALVVGMAWAAVAWRGEIMHAWPPSERIYAALGLTADR